MNNINDGRFNNQANYDDVTTQLYKGSFVVLVVVDIVVVVVVIVNVNVVVTDHSILSCGK